MTDIEASARGDLFDRSEVPFTSGAGGVSGGGDTSGQLWMAELHPLDELVERAYGDEGADSREPVLRLYCVTRSGARVDDTGPLLATIVHRARTLATTCPQNLKSPKKTRLSAGFFVVLSAESGIDGRG